MQRTAGRRRSEPAPALEAASFGRRLWRRAPRRLKVGIALVLLTSACSGEQSLTLAADPESAPADGQLIVALRAGVVFRDEPLPDGKSVLFMANQPLLFQTVEDATPELPELRQRGKSEVGVRTRGGVATAYLLAPTDAASLEVTASYTTVNKDVLTDSVTVDFSAPPLVAAAGNVSPEFSSVERYFQFDCDVPAVGGFQSPRPEIRVNCSVLVLRDAAGRELHHTPVRFFAEAGAIEETPAGPSEPRRITYVVPVAPTRWPTDVEPFIDEEPWVEFGSVLIPGAIEQNPRDGMVTLLAVVKGHEGLDDRNGNGQWDPGEFFIDEGEPFIDVDDDSVYTSGVDQECCDSNANGRVDGPNGRWDTDVWLGRDTRILWTGPLATARGGIAPSSWNFPAGSGKDFELRVVDANGNTPAARASSDRITEDLGSGLAYAQPPTFTLHRGTGFEPPPSYPFRVLGEPEYAVGVLIDEGVRRFSFRLNDDRAPGGAAYCAARDWSLSVTVRYTLGIDYSGADFPQVAVPLAAGGILEPGATPPCP